MPLSYKNLAFEEIVNKYRNMRYASGELQYGFTNSVSHTLVLTLDVDHLAMQADVFTQGMDKYRSKLMLKKYISSRPSEWSQMLHETYVYDRIRCIFYGLNYNSLGKLPENINAFPGNILLMHFLAKGIFKFEENNEQPFSFTVYLEQSQQSFMQLVQPILTKYPNLSLGLTQYSNTYFYNSHYERILTGLYNDKVYLTSRTAGKNSKNNMDNVFEITHLNDDKLLSFLSHDSNPIGNSFLNKDRTQFLFNMPYDKSGPEALRFNESIFLTRALGFVGSNFAYRGNSFYTNVPRSTQQDFLTREEVYAVTGIKTNSTARTEDEMKFYLKVVNLVSQLMGEGITNEEETEEDSEP